MFGQVINVGCGSVGMLLSMSGHEKHTLYGISTALLLNASIAIALIPTLGAIGAALGSMLSNIILNIILTWKVTRFFGIRIGIV